MINKRLIRSDQGSQMVKADKVKDKSFLFTFQELYYCQAVEFKKGMTFKVLGWVSLA